MTWRILRDIPLARLTSSSLIMLPHSSRQKMHTHYFYVRLNLVKICDNFDSKSINCYLCETWYIMHASSDARGSSIVQVASRWIIIYMDLGEALYRVASRTFVEKNNQYAKSSNKKAKKIIKSSVCNLLALVPLFFSFSSFFLTCSPLKIYFNYSSFRKRLKGDIAYPLVFITSYLPPVLVNVRELNISLAHLVFGLLGCSW